VFFISKIQDEDVFEELKKFGEDAKKQEKYRNIYSSFNNYPINIKKEIIKNILIAIAVTIAFLYCVFSIHYISVLLVVSCVALVGYLLLKTWAIDRHLKYADFIDFTGEIVESYPVGSKLANNFHYVIKLRNDEGKELCFRYFDNESLVFGQSITLFIRENAEVTTSAYGPIIENYIEAIPTDEIESKMQMEDIKNDNESEYVSVEKYLKK
jgi:hypothetical protein